MTTTGKYPGSDPQLRARAIALTHALRKLHKALIDVETMYFGEVGSPLEHLQLITTHPHFAWLQKLSSLMAELDERLDEKEHPFDRAAATDSRTAIEALIGPGKEIDAEFRRKYNALLHDGADVVSAHGAVRQALAGIGVDQPR
jgi:hypothetical protein